MLVLYISNIQTQKNKIEGMRNSPQIKITESVIYYQDSLDQDSKKVAPKTGSSHIQLWLSRAFDTYDKNQTGKLDYKQFKIFIEESLKKGFIGRTNNRDIEFYMSRMDQNRDGLISKSQFISFLREYYNVNPQFSPFNKQQNKENTNNNFSVICTSETQKDSKIKQLVDQVFIKYDANKTGELDFVELNNFIRMELNGKYTYSQIMQWADKDNNKLINKSQLHAFLKHICVNHQKK